MCPLNRRMEQSKSKQQQKLTAVLRPEQTQRQVYSFSQCGKTVVRMLSLNAAQMTEYLKREAERNPCVELTFPQAGSEDLLELLVPAKTDYREELFLQLPADIDKRVLKIARALIRNLNDFGYLPVDPLKRCSHEGKAAVTAALRIVQSLEPAGVGARSLRENYWIQANRGKRPSEELRALLQNAAAFRLYAHGSFEEVCKRLGWDKRQLERVTEALGRFAIHPVEPETDPSVYVRPDAELFRTEDGYGARLLEHALPHVSLSAAYVDSLQEGGGRFVNEGIYYANRLIYCLEHRNATLLAVLQLAADRQRAYLDGKSRVRLPMSEAAGELGLNRSTVSRAVSGKYVLFGNRVFPASELFTSAGKGDLSREGACDLIREILRGQTGEKPISDRALAERIEQRSGVSLSRRTINKYRAMLRLSAAERSGV